MNGLPLKDEGFEVLDSTDWLATALPKLSAVEAALRCQVCKDFYTSPMITSCCHTFCSLCIRRALSENGRCPFCRASDQEIKLRLNNSVYDMVEAFKAARPELLEHASPRQVTVRGASPKRMREHSGVASEDGGPSSKRTRSSRRIAEATARIEAVDSDTGDEEFIPDDGIVQCPICQKRVKQDIINVHIDRNCVDEPSKPRGGRLGTSQSASTIPQKEPQKLERLAQPNYSMLKDAPLRKKLLDQGLSTAGTRQILERRYAEWVTLWNANCDARIPKGKYELKRELEIWERTQGSRAQVSGSLNLGSQIKEKDFDGKAWASKHEDSFRDLIANARRKLPVKQPAPTSDQVETSVLVEPTSTSNHTASSSSISVEFTSPSCPALASTESQVEHRETTTIGCLPESSQIPPHTLPSEFQDRSYANNTQYIGEIPNKSQQTYHAESHQDPTLPPPSQYSGGIQILERDARIGSDMSTLGTIQP